MALAARLLRLERQTNLEVIAERCGFQSLASFSKRFKMRYGVTPGEWRRGWRLAFREDDFISSCVVCCLLPDPKVAIVLHEKTMTVRTDRVKRMRLRLRAAAAVMLAGLALVGCDQKGNEAKHIKVGVINGAEQDVAEVAKKVAKEKYGLEVELVGFSGSLLPNESTNAGDLDANVFQHRPFLEQDNKAHNYHLVAVGNTFVFPMAGYSRKIKSVAELKDGATIAIPNDPTNLGRALLLLQKRS